MYKHWTGKKVVNLKGEVFIETEDKDWDVRFREWKYQYVHGNNECPCPMPFGHLMFKGNSTNYKLIEKE